jgi:hypothetical protein
VYAPSTLIAVPVTYDDLSERSHTHAAAISAASAKAPDRVLRERGVDVCRVTAQEVLEKVIHHRRLRV